MEKTKKNNMEPPRLVSNLHGYILNISYLLGYTLNVKAGCFFGLMKNVVVPPNNSNWHYLESTGLYTY